MAGLKLVTPPAAEPVSAADIKPQLRIDLDDTTFDEQINSLIPAAREWCEGYQNRAFINRDYDLALDTWPRSAIRIPRPPLVSVASIKYRDSEGNVTTWDSASYLVDVFGEPAEIWPVNCWPSASLQKVNGIVIRYTAGYGADAIKVPANVLQAITMLVCHYFECGIVEPPQAVKSLLDLDRVVPV